MPTLAALPARKQVSEQAHWRSALDTLPARYPRALFYNLLDRTVDAVRRFIAGYRRVAFAWSGGKDSVALELVMRQAGVGECLLAISDLEYPSFLEWVTDAMPPLLDVVCTGQDLRWLTRNQTLLFPQDARTAVHWFKIIQHTAQASYYRRMRLDCLVLGRRAIDGNYTGPAGSDRYTNRDGITRYSPLRDWSHDDVLAAIVYENLPLAPFYTWPNGFRCGTHSWPARQYTGSTEQGYREVYGIDPTRVIEAARFLPSAARFLETL